MKKTKTNARQQWSMLSPIRINRTVCDISASLLFIFLRLRILILS